MLVERPQAFNKTMEKAERMRGAKEDVLWGYPGRISTLICRPME